MNATTIQNVVTYNTMVAFDNPDLKLFPGMTAYISIPVSEAKNVVKIPNGALRFKPDLSDSQISSLYAKYGIQDSSSAAAATRMAAAAPSGGAATGAAATPAGPGGQAAPAASGGGNAGGTGGGAGGGGNGRRGQGGSGGSRRQDSAVVWKLLPDKSLQPVQVSLGVTDFTFTEQVSGNLAAGDDLVIGQSVSKASTAATRNPVSGAGGGAPGVPRRF
jgi:HlyD family secretion protein